MSVEFENISLDTEGQRKRFLQWLDEKIKEGEVIEIPGVEFGFRSSNNEDFEIFRFFKTKENAQVWILTTPDRGWGSFYRFHPESEKVIEVQKLKADLGEYFNNLHSLGYEFQSDSVYQINQETHFYFQGKTVKLQIIKENNRYMVFLGGGVNNDAFYPLHSVVGFLDKTFVMHPQNNIKTNFDDFFKYAEQIETLFSSRANLKFFYKYVYNEAVKRNSR